MKKIFLVALTIAALFTLAGCNKQMFDTQYKYDKAIIHMANDKIVEVDVDKWNDYDGEQIQIIAKDGTVYLTSSTRCDLIRTK